MNPEDLPTVLVVDDERINRTALADLLQDECRVILAKDGPSALERVANEPVSLILLDAVMPGMDGYDVLRKLKADEKTSGIGVIFVTGRTEERDEERALLLGAADYITKPIRAVVVRARVRNHLKLARKREELERLTLQDGLTGIGNRRCFDQELARACAYTVRTGEPFGLALIDVDDFKPFNDRYGHGVGDDALRRVARILSGAARRACDTAARYGGEEFALLLPGVESFSQVLENVRASVLGLRIEHEASRAAPHLTISCGGVIAGPEAARRPEQLLIRADAALYEAKRQGRNRVAMPDGSTPPGG